MPTFRQRPLTWLFWIATACATVTGYVRDSNSNWFNELLLSQLYVISGWAAVSEVHRLARASVLLLAPIGLALTTYPTQQAPDEGEYVLAFGLILTCLIFIATRVLSFAVRAIGQSTQTNGKHWQISLVEMFGWTIVTAIGSWAVSKSKLPPMERVGWVWETLASIIPASIMMALFLAPRPRHDRASLLISLAGLIAFYAAANLLGNLSGGEHWVFTVTFGYVALWILVVRLDEQAASTASSDDSRQGIKIADVSAD